MIHGCGSLILITFWIIAALFGVFAVMYYLMAIPLWSAMAVTVILFGISFFLIMGDA